MSAPVPGWYPDPQNSSLARWWDGTRWSSATQSAATLQAQGSASLRTTKPRRRIDDNFVRLAYVLQGLLVLVILVDLGVIWGDRFVMDVADQFIAGDPDIDDAAMSDRINLVGGAGEVLVFLTTGIVFIRWLFVAHASDRMLPEAQNHRSGWAIGGWFVPILNVWRPFGVAIDLRRGVLGSEAKATALMWVWWLVLLASTAFSRYAGEAWLDNDATSTREFGEDLRLAAETDLASSSVEIVAAVLAILVVRQLTRLVRQAPVVS